jgi:hypothetical protein
MAILAVAKDFASSYASLGILTAVCETKTQRNDNNKKMHENSKERHVHSNQEISNLDRSFVGRQVPPRYAALSVKYRLPGSWEFLPEERKDYIRLVRLYKKYHDVAPFEGIHILGR